MKTLELLDLLRQKDVKIWAEGEHVHINAPKGILTPDLKAQIHESKEELKRLLYDSQRVGLGSGSPIVPSHGVGPLPLSYAQERLWFLDHLQPQNPAYNISSAFTLSGNLRVGAFEQALQDLTQRHEILRTIFPEIDGRPIQECSSTSDSKLNIKDLRNLPETIQTETIRQILKQETHTPFHLGEGPLWRCTLVQQHETRNVLVLVIHHIVADAWSLDIFFRELMVLYHAILESLPSPLPSLGIQYGDFAQWQRKEKNQTHWSEQLEYWRKQLSGSKMFLELPTDRPRPSVQNFEGNRVPFKISKDTVAGLTEMSRGEQSTLFMTILAAFQTLLFRYSGQAEFLVGVPVAGRIKPEVAGLIGLFANTLALRADLSESLPFVELLARTRRVSLNAFANQDLPFEQVVTALQPERTLSHSPLFQVMLAYQNLSSGREKVLQEIPGLGIAPLSIEQQTAKFDLTLFIEETSSGLDGGIEYRTDLFEEETIRRMAGHFETLLQGIVANPQQSIASLPLLTQSEKQQILVEWNATDRPYPTRCLHELIEEQAVRTPNEQAVIFEGCHLSYKELNQRANRVANYLRKAGVGPEVLVGIYLNRSIDMLVSLLGVLKSGGAYVPLDLSWPKERIRLIMDESQMAVMLTQKELFKTLPSPSAIDNGGEFADLPALDLHTTQPWSSTQVVCLDAIVDELVQEPADNLLPNTTPDNLAYVIYTSGSTGTPKGVMVPHRGLVNYLTWCIDAYHVKDGNGSLVHSSMAFDLAVTSLFAPLLVGKSISIIPETAEIDTLSKVLSDHPGWSFLKLTPSHLEMLNYRMPDRDQCVQRLIVGGETLTGRTVNTWRSQDHDVTVVNEYGPTEAIVGCCVYEVPTHEKPSPDALPIGRPISNVRLYILDQSQQPVPIGVPGELYIGGHGVARGYMNQPELTREKFIANPFSSDPGDYLYKTGDRCRYRVDGIIEFIGRLDRQVKVRGFRVELGEVESILQRHPAVQEAIVVLNDQLSGDALVAYVVPHSATEPQEQGRDLNFSTLENALRKFLQDRVPGYMMPSVFVNIDSVPLTQNGKVDYQALVIPEHMKPLAHQTVVPPQDALEWQLLKIWEDVLGLRSISVKDKFFEIGGHSLLAVRVFSQIEKILGYDLPVATLFQAPTIEELAQKLRQSGWVPPWNSLVPIQPKGSYTPLFCIHEGSGDILCFRDLAQALGTDQPVYGLQPPGLDGKQLPLTSVESFADHYVKQIRAFQPEGPYMLGGRCFGMYVAFEIARQLREQGETVGLLASFDTLGNALSPESKGLVERPVFRVRLRSHLIKMSGKNFEQKFWLLGRWGMEKLEPIVVKLQWLLCECLDMMGWSLPKILRRFVVLEGIRKARMKYVGSIYDGHMVVFQNRNGLDPTLIWGPLVSGGIEVYEVPGGHVDMFKYPHVEVLAKKLKECIQKVDQATVE